MEVIHRYADPACHADLISIVLLARHVEKENEEESRKLKDRVQRKPFDMPEINDVDKTDLEISRICPSLPLPVIRKYSFSSLLYDHLRNPYVHEYRPLEDAITWVPNYLWSDRVYSRDSGRLVDESTRRHRLFFGLEWIADIAISVAKNLDRLFPKQCELGRPEKWWLDGGDAPSTTH